MRFSAVTVLALAGTSMASTLVKRVPIPFAPRGISKRQNQDNMSPALDNLTACAKTDTSYVYCDGNQACASGDNQAWCCPKDQQNCPKPTMDVCGPNNGPCSSGFTCMDANGAKPYCQPDNVSSFMSSYTQKAGQSAQNASDNAQNNANQASQNAQNTANQAVANITSAANNATASIQTAVNNTIANATQGSQGSQGTQGGNQTAAPAQAGAGKLSGVSALAFAIMAGVYLL